jgi:predicted transposase YdaD
VPRTVHDGYFKSVFSDPALAADELRAILPVELVARIDWPLLAPMPASFVDEVLAQRVGDLVFRAPLTEGGEALLWFLIEHQRRAERWMILRVVDMHDKMWRQWLRIEREADTVPAIVPVVVYHGRRPWRAPRSMAEVYRLPASTSAILAPHLLSCRYVLDDLSVIADQDLRARQMDAFARLSLFAMACGGAEDFLERLAGNWSAELRSVMMAGNHERMAALLHYTVHVNPRADVQALREHLRPTVGEEVEEVIVTVADKLRQEGYDKGFERGREQTLEQERRRLLQRMLGQRFGALPQAVLTRISAAGSDDLQRWLDRVLIAGKLDEIFVEQQ